ncbi:hypothetical protein NFI96_009308 [Prochilodus magdalenae]|nr:hypothetical protein NFI96_009308 [Prochilodus magdalenae]
MLSGELENLNCPSSVCVCVCDVCVCMYMCVWSVLPTVKNQVTGSFILNAKGEEVKSKSLIESGLEWEYLVEGQKETLKTAGPLHEDIVVLVVPQEEDTKISLTYKYIIHEDLVPIITNNNVLLAELDTYEWALKSWSQCTKPCGGGVQYTKYGCRRKSDSRLVHRNFCEVNKKPKPIRKRCNVNECSQPTPSSVDTGRCPQDTTLRKLPTGRCPQDTTLRKLPTGHCPQDAAHRTLPTGSHLTGRCPRFSVQQ